MYKLIFYSLFALAFTPSAFSAFVDLLVEDITDNSLGLSEYAIYATFDSPDEILTLVGSANITSSTGFFHNTINGTGASALPFPSAQTAISDHPDADSFVTIGLMTGDDNETMLTPNFDETQFIEGTSLGFNAGWFNPDPFNGQGDPDDEGKILIAVFTPLNDMQGNPGIVSGEMIIGFGTPGNPQTAFASFTTIPTPATLAVLGLGGVLGRLRRRR